MSKEFKGKLELMRIILENLNLYSSEELSRFMFEIDVELRERAFDNTQEESRPANEKYNSNTEYGDL